METFNHICITILLGASTLIVLTFAFYTLITVIDYYKSIKRKNAKLDNKRWSLR